MQNGKTALKVSPDLELRLPQTEFAEPLFAIIDQERAYLRQWLSWVDETKSVENIQDFLKTSRLLNKGGQRLTTFVFYKERIVGSIGLVKIDKQQRICEIGYWLQEHLQGQGIMSRACRRLVDYTFGSMEINRIEIKVAAPNTKSQGIPRRLGFVHEATLREALFLHEQHYDVELFSFLRVDWQESKSLPDLTY
jgi:ribosomal-protein-serine acetyltransferase